MLPFDGIFRVCCNKTPLIDDVNFLTINSKWFRLSKPPKGKRPKKRVNMRATSALLPASIAFIPLFKNAIKWYYLSAHGI